jgi:glycosyltransferase involved in cell wall biosynthesis
MRVLHIQRVKGIGGSERHLLALLPALRDRGIDVRMCVLQVGDGDRFVREMRGTGVDVVVKRGGHDANPLLLAQLVSEIRAYRPDLVHTHLVHADVYGQLAARVARVTGLSSVHGTPSFYLRQPYLAAGKLVGRLAARRIAISEHVASWLRSTGLAAPDRIRVVYYGIDPDPWTAASADRGKARAAFGLVDGDVVVGIASRLIPGKGHDLLVDALGRARRECPELKLLIAGEGTERAAIERAAVRCGPPGTVQVLGFLPDVPAFYAACDVVAFPTQPELSEGFGLAALEAMAGGKPVVASSVGSLPEVVDDGVTGVLFPASSADALASALVDLARDESWRFELGVAGEVRARRDFPLEAMVSRTIDVYEDLL